MIPRSAKVIARWAQLTTVAVIGTLALAGGTAHAAPSTVVAETSDVVAAAYPCGLSGEMRDHMIPGWNWYHYRIRNCHSYGVRRFLNVTNTFTKDGPCTYIPANGIAFMPRLEFNVQFDVIIGLGRC